MLAEFMHGTFRPRSQLLARKLSRMTTEERPESSARSESVTLPKALADHFEFGAHSRRDVSVDTYPPSHGSEFPVYEPSICRPFPALTDALF